LTVREDLESLTPGFKHEQSGEGEWITMEGFEGCCDCGLVHRIEWRVKLPSGEIVMGFPEGTKLQLRKFRESELTNGARMSNNWVCTLKQKGER
jgi:hypothetical protein